MSAKILYFLLHACTLSDCELPDVSKASSEMRPSQYRMIGNRHLCGTDLRCLHFSRLDSRTPSANAASVISSQSNVISLMEYILADNSSARQGHFGGGTKRLRFLYFGMGKKESRAAEELALHLYLKETMRNYREAKGWSQAYLGKLLGLSKATYEKYEGYNPQEKLRKVPVLVVADFAKLASYSFDALIQGRSRKSA